MSPACTITWNGNCSCAYEVQDGQERDAFFKRLPAQLPNIPVPVAQRKLLPMISQALEFGGAPSVALGEFVPPLMS